MSRRGGNVAAARQAAQRAERRSTDLAAENEMLRGQVADLRRRLHLDPARRAEQGLPPLPAPEFKGLTETEAAFVARALERNWQLYRSGWPDFLCFDPQTKRFLLVEVRSESEKLLPSQRAMFEALESAGFPVRIYRPGQDALLPWRKAEALAAAARRED